MEEITMKEVPITNIDGIKIGHAHDLESATGCTAVICEQGAVAGVDVRGGAPGTLETDMLLPENLIEKVHAVLLTGGSAFGLDAASGVNAYLEEQGVGLDVQVARLPIVCGAVIFDLMIGDPKTRPDRDMGYAAAEAAGRKIDLEGCVGAGAGATVGKLLGMETAMKSGTGCYCLEEGDLKVGALAVVNCLGDVIEPKTGNTLAGLLGPDKKSYVGTEKAMVENFLKGSDLLFGNTTIGIIITNADFTKAQAKKISSMAHNGYARAMRPAHSMYDGDTIFSMTTGEVAADVSVVGLLAARVMERAVVRAATEATSLFGFKCHRDMAP